MPQPLSKRIARAVATLAEAEKTAYDAEVAFEAFATTATAEIAAWPKNPDGTLMGYNATTAQLLDALGLAHDRRIAAEAHALGAALLLEVLN